MNTARLKSVIDSLSNIGLLHGLMLKNGKFIVLNNTFHESSDNSISYNEFVIDLTNNEIKINTRSIDGTGLQINTVDIISCDYISEIILLNNYNVGG